MTDKYVGGGLTTALEILIITSSFACAMAFFVGHPQLGDLAPLALHQVVDDDIQSAPHPLGQQGRALGLAHGETSVPGR
ncbi:hypothetical protein [Baekduia sp. Peel2402]|uniref:hypothetical protein n=1 Tax=Baekduia sp. Peel2402 TaxID=3458296 RepID=UPI00403E6413